MQDDVWGQVWEELTPGDLKGDLKDIALERGMEDAKHLVEVAGGHQFYVPVAGSNQTLNKIAKHLRPDLYLYLLSEWKRCQVYVPTHASVLKRYREQYPEQLLDATPSQLAHAFGIGVIDAEELVEQAQSEQAQ